MTSTRQPIALSNIVIGLGTMGVGIVFALSTLGLVEARDFLRFWPVMLVVLGLAMVVQALWNSGAPAASHDSGYGWFAALIVAVALISYLDVRREPTLAADGFVNVHAVAGRQEQAVSGSFQSATVTSVMGRSVLDLGNASLEPGQEAVIDVLTLMGRTDVRVPPGWEVDMRAVSIFGSAGGRRNRRARSDEPTDSAQPDPPAPPGAEPRPKLVVRGVILMGGMSIGS